MNIVSAWRRDLGNGGVSGVMVICYGYIGWRINGDNVWRNGVSAM